MRFLFVLLVLTTFSTDALATAMPTAIRQKKAKSKKERTKVSVRRIEQIVPTSTTAPPPKNAVSGEHAITVVLIETDDAKFTDADPKAAVEKMFFGEDTRSLRNYYKEQSYGAYQITGKVVGPIKVKGKLASYSYGPGQDGKIVRNLVKSTFDTVAADIDMKLADRYNVFSQPTPDGAVDHFAIIFPAVMKPHEGYFKPIWPHRGTIEHEANGKKMKSYYIFSFPMPLGTLAHEHGHDIGLPDLYDRDDSSHGAGPWCLMASGSWLGGGNLPGHVSAWGKVQMGWVRPRIIAKSQNRVEIPAVESTPTVLKIPVGSADSSEFFLVENRQRIGYDSQLPDEGLLIWHIDTSIKHNDDEQHKLVDLVEPASVQDLDQMFRDQDPDFVDAYRAGKKTRFGEDTDPSSRDYAGKATGITVTDISASKGVMSASFNVPTITVPEGEPYKLIRDNYAFGGFGAVPLGAGSEELMPFTATEGAYDIQAIEGLFMARPNTKNPLAITIYEDAGGQPGKVRAQTTGVLETKADSYAWAKTALPTPVRMTNKQKFWVGIAYDRDQVAAAYNPDSVSKEARYRRGGKGLQAVYNFAKGKEQVPDFIMRVHGYGFIGVAQPSLPAQADENDELIKRMREADAMLDKKQFLEASAQYTQVLQRMAQNPMPFLTWIPVVINALGVADYQAKNWKGALDMFARSLKFAQMMKDPRAESDILENIGETHFHAGNMDDALAYCSRAREMNADVPDRLLESEYWLGRILVARGEQAAAEKHLAAALSIVNTLHKDAPEKWRARIARAKAGTATGEDEESRAAKELSEDHKAEAAPEAEDNITGNKVDLRDFGIGGGN